MATETERVANAHAWVLGGGVDAPATDLNPNHGPVWVSWHNPTYNSWTEKFDTAGHAADEMWKRTGDSYYPLWYDTSALVYGADPEDAEAYGEYPLAEFVIRDDEDGDYTIVLLPT